MKKVYRVEVKMELEEASERNAIRVAREHYLEVGGAEESVDDQSDQCRRVPPEEFISDAVCAIVELLSSNALLEKAEIDVIEVSCHEAEAAGT